MILTTRSLVCREAVALMSDYLDDSLSRRNRRRLEKHLAACDACTAYLDQLRITIAASSSVSPDDLDPEVLDGLVDLFHQFRDSSDND